MYILMLYHYQHVVALHCYDIFMDLLLQNLDSRKIFCIPGNHHVTRNVYLYYKTRKN